MSNPRFDPASGENTRAAIAAAEKKLKALSLPVTGRAWLEDFAREE